MCVLRRRSLEKRWLIIVKVTFRVLCMIFILYLCTRIAIISYFLIEHLKRLSVMDGRFFRSFAEAEMGVIKANTGVFTGNLDK